MVELGHKSLPKWSVSRRDRSGDDLGAETEDEDD